MHAEDKTERKCEYQDTNQGHRYRNKNIAIEMKLAAWKIGDGQKY